MKPCLNPKRAGLWHGGDYNPEQWPEEIWHEDMRLMKLAGFQVATVGVFSWASYEPREGVFEFGWLDKIMDLLAENGRHAILATPSAAMPSWLSQKHPEILRAGPDGKRRRHGNRVNYCLSSPEYRHRAAKAARTLAARYQSHPALVLWHVSNEYGGECCCETCAEAFREWLKKKHNNDLDELNRRWWTKFWSHTYSDWSQIEIPGAPYGEEAVLGMTMDWKRFVSDQTIDFMKGEMAPLREITPETPITTNMMGFYPVIDYPKMAKELDLVTWDSYPNFDGLPMNQDTWQKVAMVHDAYRAMIPGKPFLLIESTPSTSNWYPYMRCKPPGVHKMEMLQAIAHGSDGAMYFQWRQSKGSAEMYHGAVVTHAGAEGVRVFEEVCDLGAALGKLKDVAGSVAKADVALIYDWEANWAHETLRMPLLGGFPYLSHCMDWHYALWQRSTPVDVVDQTAELGGFKVAILPAAIKLRSGMAEKLKEFVWNGGCLVASCLTGHVDDDLLAYEGGAPGPLKEILGLSVHEVDALHPSEHLEASWNDASYRIKSVCELASLNGAEALGTYAGKFYKGQPFLTRNSFGSGAAYWVGADLGRDFTSAFINDICLEARVEGVLSAAPYGVVATRRKTDNQEFLFIMNFNEHESRVTVPSGFDGLDGRSLDGPEIVMAPREVRVLTRITATAAR